ncbi:MAG: HAD family hydrolase [Paraglaciecola sp.]|uniref:HAD family hydrolase n=1 Tax=Paraglaciecola sp. TaxID=1920173 RepID=UPI00273FB44A|nr:HAD family hydrolase [Paraglaciecola sp.]MDP5032489.1 HAD family hydrolase [Paraglaciecola sp.]MDP5129653.1 HAD family hydrolase [Paraglaciecola sp.]
MSNYELIIFDCDGVLIDSEGISYKTLKSQLQEIGITIDDEYFIKNCLGRSFGHVKQTLLADFNVLLPEDFEQTHQAALVKDFERDLVVTPSIKSLLGELTINFCLATSSSRPRTLNALKITGLNQYFSDNVFTTSEVAKGKPAPDLFLHAAQKMGVAPEKCLVFEDSLSGIQAAKSAGMDVYRYMGGSHLLSTDLNLSSGQSDYLAFRHWRELTKLVPSIISNK